jgi:hypothetical protein
MLFSSSARWRFVWLPLLRAKMTVSLGVQASLSIRPLPPAPVKRNRGNPMSVKKGRILDRPRIAATILL